MIRLRKGRARLIATLTTTGLALAMATAACSSASSPASNNAAANGTAIANTPTNTASEGSATETSGAPLPVRISLIGPPPLTPMLWADVAKEQGYFAKVGLTPTFSFHSNGTDVAKTVVAKSVDIGGMPPTTAVAQLVSQNVPIVMVAGMDVQDWVIGVSDPAIKTCQDLKGQAVGDDGPGNARAIFLNVVLESCGLKMSDVKAISFGGANAAAQAAASGRIKASVLHASEVPQVEAVSKSLQWHIITPPTSVIDSGHFMGFTVLKDYLATDKGKETTERTVAAYILAREWMMNPANLDAFAALAAKAQGQTAEAELEGLKLLQSLHFWSPGIGLTESNVTGEIKILANAGTIPADKAPSYAQMVDPSIYPAALAIAQKVDPSAK